MGKDDFKLLETMEIVNKYNYWYVEFLDDRQSKWKDVVWDAIGGDSAFRMNCR